MRIYKQKEKEKKKTLGGKKYSGPSKPKSGFTIYQLCDYGQGLKNFSRFVALALNGK